MTELNYSTVKGLDGDIELRIAEGNTYVAINSVELYDGIPFEYVGTCYSKDAVTELIKILQEAVDNIM